MSDLLTQFAYAKHRGVTHRAVQKAIASGRLSKCLSTNDKGRVLIDPAIADHEWNANTDVSKPSSTAKQSKPTQTPDEHDAGASTPSIAGGIPDFNDSRAIREAYLARLAKLEYEERSGKLMVVDEAKVAIFNVAREARNMLMAIPDRLSSQLAGINDEFECHRLLSAEIKLVCERIAQVNLNGNQST